MTVTPITWCDAEMFLRPMSAGRTKPISVRARTDAGDAVECVVKLASRLTMPPVEYLAEWWAAAIGRELGVNVPAPLAVRLAPEFAETIDDREVAFHVRRSAGVVYGSTFVAGYTQIAAGYPFSPALREDATRVLVFDTLIHNPDRRVENANLHMSRDRLLAFDHEQAFSFLLPLFGAPDPIDDPCADIIGKHALRAILREGMDGIAEAAASLARLDDQFFADLEAATPAEWTQGHALGKIDRLAQVLQARRDAARRWVPQVEALVTT